MPPPFSVLYHSLPCLSSKDVVKINGKKMGRPTDDPKNRTVRFRLTESERQKLAECSRLSGLSLTDVIMRGIDKVYQELTEKEPES